MTLRPILATAMAILGVIIAGNADTIAYWNFNSLTIGTAALPGVGAVPSSIPPDIGAGNLSLTGWLGTVDDFGGSTVNAQAAAPAEESLSLIAGGATFPGNGTYIELQLNMSALENPVITYATRSSGTTGFTTGTWTYSVGGGAFTTVPSGVVTPTTSSTFGLATIDLSTLDVVDGAADVKLRYALTGATAATGSNRIDNLLVSATVNPFPTFRLSLANNGTATGGNFSGAGSYLSGTSATATATPSAGYLFGSWTGDASGSSNPLTLLMDSDKTVRAYFVEDTRDPDADGLTNYQEIITYGTDPEVADSDGDSIGDGAEIEQGRSPLVPEPVVSNLTATQRPGTKLVDITYDVTADTPTVKVTLEISSDGGTTYSVPVASATGAVGNGIAVETGKMITWNAGVDWDGKFTPQTRFKVVADNSSTPGDLAWVPAGSFSMGDNLDESSDAPVVTVNVSTFYMGKHEVTKGLWDQVWAWAAANGYTDLAGGEGKASNHPVQTVSWWDVVKWCNARSQKEGLLPCYTVNGTVMKTGATVPTVNWNVSGYRLPTEAEWEKAARGGVSGRRFPWGTDTISHSQANYYASSSFTYDSSGASNNFNPTYARFSFPYTSPVGSLAANGYGLYDMAGNVFEWCWDWDWVGVSTYLNGATDPRGAASGSYRVFRGGSWYDRAKNCRVAHRNSSNPSSASSDYGLGFRVIRVSLRLGFLIPPGIGGLACLA